MKKLAVFLAIGVLGVTALLLGLALDAYLHAQDPTLAHREGIFTLSNPGHFLLGAGIALVVVGLIGAAYSSLPSGSWVRRGLLVASLVLIVVSSDAAGWAASVESTTPNGASAAATEHNHAAVPATVVTGAQLQAALQLIDATKAAVAKYADERVAVDAGYMPMEPEGLQVMHYVNNAYFTDADILQPNHVQSLIYFNSTHGPVLIGAMYIMPKLGMAGPDIGGSLTVWHHHDNLCFDRTTGVIVAFAHDSSSNSMDKSGTCPRGSSNRSTPEMLHVWLIANPGGPFNSDMSPDVLVALN
ncbi:MAG TPA: hypothetical protein VGU71_08995 [Candidatus Dormibacteraeota bacterium]|nr:hypothetical protein [Candidatus Dormibacteraeota bacterium]